MIVIKLSGKLFENITLIYEYINIIKKYVDKGAIVVGGGETARRYIDYAKRLGANNYFLDVIGIEASRLNAWVVVAGLGEDAYPKPAETLAEALAASASRKYVVLGGLQPGQSTSTVAALVAEALNARVLINCAGIDAVYEEDPRSNPSAKKYDEVKAADLLAILRSRALPGTYELADIWSLEILRRSKIPMYIVDGRNPKLLEGVLLGRAKPGTVVVPE
ncbi:MAG: UMP kinase [Thermoproteus sp.]|nr:UMP kinase [Thermoproteus sp.]